MPAPDQGAGIFICGLVPPRGMAATEPVC